MPDKPTYNVNGYGDYNTKNLFLFHLVYVFTVVYCQHNDQLRSCADSQVKRR